MAKRLTLPKDEYDDLKLRVFRRDKGKCRKCGSTFRITAHHVIFRSDMGPDTSSNLVTLCQDRCHKAVHGLISNFFLEILHPDSDLIPPDCDKGIRFKTHNKVQRRTRWRL